jgi:CheY-like chemotaxis protein
MSKTLLLADDSLTIQRVVDLTFAQEDVRVVSFAGGDQAVKWMEDEMPDIVLADVGMPQPDGYAVAQHMKQSARLRDVPVLLLAGAFEPLDDNKARDSACDGVLTKPFEPQHLVSRVIELLGRHRHLTAVPPPAPAHADAPEAAFESFVGDAPAPIEAPVEIDHRPELSALPESPAEPVMAAEPVAPSQPAERVGLHLVEPPVPAATHEPVNLQSFATDLAELDGALELIASEPAMDSIDPPLDLEWDPPIAPGPVAAMESHHESALEPLAPLTPLSTESWDLAAVPSVPAPEPPAPSPVLSHEPEPVQAAPAQMAQPAHQTAPPMSLASAFAALLAAEANPAASIQPAGHVVNEAAIEDIVRRVLQRVTDDMVRGVVLEAAERMVKAEIDKIKDSPEQ